MNMAKWRAGMAIVVMLACAPGQGRENENALDAAERAQLVAVLGQKLRDRYVDPATGAALQATLTRKHAAGDYAGVHTRSALASILSSDLQVHSKDRHLRVMLETAVKTPAHKRETSSRAERFKLDNYGIGEVLTLPGNIGYLELRGFIPLSFAKAPYADAMQRLSGSAALIVDLRRNGGGDPASVAYLSSYLFDKRTHLNDLRWRRGAQVDSFWTTPSVPGTKLAMSAPVFVLTSPQTFSAAEEFSYNLQQLKRATIVGEASGGGAHPGEVVELGEHFSAFISTGRAVNPISKSNWEGRGVQPDVAVPAAEALLEAQRLALAQLEARAVESADKARLTAQLDALTGQQARSGNWLLQQPLYLRGSMNGWDTSLRMSPGGSSTSLQAELRVDAGLHEFKIASADFAAVDLGAARAAQGPSQDGAITMVDYGQNVRLQAASAGVYRFVLDVADPQRPRLSWSHTP